jgi:glycerol-3-phosphate transporter
MKTQMQKKDLSMDEKKYGHNCSKQNDASIGKAYSYWRLRIMYSMMLGYAAFYLVRQNFTMAIPFFQSELGYSKTEIGQIMTTGAIIYGLGKGIAGLLSDKSNARYFMSAGLFLSAIVSFFLGFGESWYFLLAFWVMNNVFQSMGWPPCARLLTHWFSPKEIGTKWATWNASQQIGAASCMLICGFIVQNNYNWRLIFFVPSIICLFLAVFLFNRLRDTPESLGLPPIEQHKKLVDLTPNQVEDSMTTKEIFLNVIKNKLVWYVCFANFFVYIVRMSIFSWAPTFLREFKGSTLQLAAWQTAAYDITGIFGGLIAGYLSDKFFKGHRGRVGVISMLILSGCIFWLWQSPVNSPVLHFLIMMLIGFLVTGPQILVGVAAADFASKRAAGAASGLTGTVGYIGTAVTGVGIGFLVDNYGWDKAFIFIIISAFLSVLFFALTWNHRSKVLDS